MLDPPETLGRIHLLWLAIRSSPKSIKMTHPTGCNGWSLVDNNPKLAYIVAGPTTVYEMHQDGSIWQYSGIPCNYNATVCSGCTMLDNNPLNVQDVAGF
jgi:hypothetical protein